MMQNCLKFILLGAFLCFVTNASDQCDTHITYNAFIATTEADQGTADFVGEFNIHNHQADVDAWLLGFKLSKGEELAGADQVMTSDVYVDPASSTNDITLEWIAPENESFKNGDGKEVKFIGQKDISKFNGTVSAVQSVEFNNVKCEQVMETEQEEPDFIEASTYGVEVDFRPIEIIQKDGSQSQQVQVFHIDLISKSDVSLYLNFLKIQYYFAGGFNDMFAKASDYVAVCVASESLICKDLTFNITKGVQGMDSARYMLEIGFNEKSGYLLHNTTGPTTPMFTVVPQTQELAYSEISFTLALESRIAYNYINITNDYSSIDTEFKKYVQGTDGSKTSVRSNEPDSNIPVYYNDALIAGVTPQYKKYQMDKLAAQNSTAAYNPTSCVRDDMTGSIFCSVATSYCCVGDITAPIELTPIPTEAASSPAVIEAPAVEEPTTTEEPTATTTTEEPTATEPTTTEEDTHSTDEADTHTTDEATPVTTESLKSAQPEDQQSTSDHSEDSEPSEESTSASTEDVILIALVVVVVALVIAGLVVFIQKRRSTSSGQKLQVELRNQATNGENQSLNQFYEDARGSYK